MNRSHKIRLDPSPAQESYFRRACGCVRLAYNWGLAEWKAQHEAGFKPTAFAIKKKFNAIKRTEFPFVAEVSKWGPERAFANLDKAFKSFFAKRTSFPKFKKKGHRDSFYTDGSVIRTEGKRVRLPVIGWIKMREPLRFAGKLVNGTVSCVAGKWFISLSVEFDAPEIPVRQNQTAGVDLGIKHLATISSHGNVEKVDGPKALRQLLPKLRRLQRKASRRVKGSARRRKAVLAVARLHFRIKCVRDDALHKLATNLVRRFTVVGIEDLNVAGMVRNHCLAFSLLDQAFGEFRRQLTYKAEAAGTCLVVADRFFPSSKMCRNCNRVIEKLLLSSRAWTCPHCGACHDRDSNAAGNLEDLAVGWTVTARGAATEPR